MTTLVTGGTGFVGRYIVAQLSAAGTPTISYNRDFSPSPHPMVTAVQGELFDIPALVDTLRRHEVTRIIHTAAMSHPEISIALPVTTFAANVDGTLKLFESARMAGVRRIVNFSSECAYGHQDENVVVTESATPMPNTPYAVTKVATEHLGRVYNQLYGLDVISLRVTEIYGPELRMPEVLKDMLRAAIDKVPFALPHGREHRFHFVHVRDVARAAILASAAPTPPLPIYNIAGGPQTRLGELADLVRQHITTATIDLGPGYLPDWDRQGPFDMSAAERDLGYTPEWPIDRGLPDYAQWLRDNPY